tara:strand:+ start:45 stop:254 length:210 start_codon:yes stop_codon:yes gene_type:complete
MNNNVPTDEQYKLAKHFVAVSKDVEALCILVLAKAYHLDPEFYEMDRHIKNSRDKLVSIIDQTMKVSDL